MPELKSYRFGPFLVDRRSACLRRDGVIVPLRPKSFDVLVYLAQHPGRLVPKAELIDGVWANLNVTPNSLVQCVKEIRQALHDDSQSIIETVSKRGYLFASPVTAINGDDEPATTDPDENGALPLPDRPSIAVLPFDNMSGDPDQDYFADGISEDLITGLSRIRWLFVIARNSTFVYKGRAVDIRQVASKLGVRYVLEGSVRRAGQRLRVSAQLIDAVTGGHHWAEQYDRELGDIFAIQDEITSSVVASIQPRLLAAEGVRAFSRSPGDLGAWELVARAQTHVWRLNRTDHEAAIEALNRAVDAYPDYAPARSLLGFCLVFSAHNGWIDRDQGLLAARPHIVRAIALDDCDPWGQIALGYWSMMERRTEELIAAFRRAVSRQSEFSGRALLSQPWAGVLRAMRRSHRAWQRGDPAQPAGSRHRDVPRRHYRRALSRRPIRRCLPNFGRVAAIAPGLSRCPAASLCEPGSDGKSGGGQTISRRRTA